MTNKGLFFTCLFLAFIIGIASPASVKDHNKVVGCYWGAWSFYRPYASFDVLDIDPSQCTHLFYGFAELHPKTHKIFAWDSWFDLEQGTDGDLNKTCADMNTPGCKYNSYRRFNDLKADFPHLKTMLSVGGWNAGSKDYSDMAKDPAQRKIFVDSLVPFLTRFNFDGLDIDWEYPGSRDGDKFMDKEDFTLLIQEMSEALKAKNLLFTAAVSPSVEIAERGYDLKAIYPHFDFLNVMTYDYHGWWENNSHPFTGHNAPLAGRKDEQIVGHPGYAFNVYDTMKYYLSIVPKDKLVMGVPFYGRGFILEEQDKMENGLFCPATEGLPAGHFTNLTGFWGYYDILYYFNNPKASDLNSDLIGDEDWTVVRDGCYKAPYAYNNRIWIGYDDVDSLKYKTQYANFLDIAGVMIWSIDTDDFEGKYSSEKFPLLKSINRALASDKKYDPATTLGHCETAPACSVAIALGSSTAPKPTTTALPPTTTEEVTTTEKRPAPTTATPEAPKTTADGSSSGGVSACKFDFQNLPYPGDCHKYIQCLLNDETGKFQIYVRYCGDDIFDPNIGSCIDSHLSGAQAICED